jgi:hypothetical protein
MPKSRDSDPIMGLSCLKDFGTFGYFTGTVVGVEGKMYRVRWTDGELEIVSRTDVVDLLFPEAPCVFSSVKLSGDSTRIVPLYFLSNRDDLLVWGRLEELGWRINTSENGQKKKRGAQPAGVVRVVAPHGVASQSWVPEGFDGIVEAMTYMRTTPEWQQFADPPSPVAEARSDERCKIDDAASMAADLESVRFLLLTWNRYVFFYFICLTVGFLLQTSLNPTYFLFLIKRRALARLRRARAELSGWCPGLASLPPRAATVVYAFCDVSVYFSILREKVDIVEV